MGASFSKGQSSNQQGSAQGVQFPTSFLNQLGNVIGMPYNSQTLLQGLPQSQSLFGSSPVGVGAPGGGYGPQGVYPQGGGSYSPPGSSGMGFNPQTMANPYASGFGAYAPQGYGGGGMGPPSNGGYGAQAGGPGNPSFGYGDVQSMIANANPSNLRFGRASSDEFSKAAAALGIAPGSNLNLQQVQQIGAYEQQHNPQKSYTSFLNQNLPGQLEQYANLQNPANQTAFQSSGSPSSLNVQGGLSSLQFGQALPSVQAPPINAPPGINAPQAGAAQMNIAPQGFDQYQQNIYAQQFAPTQQEIQRSGAIADQQLNSDLASRGLASSGAGVGQMQQQRQQRQVQLNNASIQAANNASVQRFGAQFGQAQQNAQLQQQSALQNANLDQQAQTQNAANILTGNIQNTGAYLQAVGLTQQQAQSQRTDFLSALGLNENDLSRMDNLQVQDVGMLLNNWLQQASLATGAGTSSRAQGSGQSTSLGQSAGVSG